MTTQPRYYAKIREERDRRLAEAHSLLDRAEKFQRALSANEKRAYDELVQQADDANAWIKQLEDSDKRERDIDEAMRKLMSQPRQDGLLDRPDSEGLWSRSWLPGMSEFRDLRAEQRAVGTSGAFIPVQYASTWFDALRKRVTVLDAGPLIVPVQHAGSVKVPRVTSSVTVSALAENAAITPADPALSDVTLDPKKFAAMTLVAREALEDSSPELRSVVADCLLRDVGVELDRQLIVGDGTGQNMRGLRNIAGVTTGASTGANGASLTFAHLADTLAAAEAANTDPDRLVWFMSSRTWGSVRKLVDSQNRPIVSVNPVDGIARTLWGKPVAVSNNLPVNETKGTSTDCSAIILADMSQVVVAQAREVELSISEDYAFNADQVAVRVTCRYDIGVPQPTALTITDGIRP